MGSEDGGKSAPGPESVLRQTCSINLGKVRKRLAGAPVLKLCFDASGFYIRNHDIFTAYTPTFPGVLALVARAWAHICRLRECRSGNGESGTQKSQPRSKTGIGGKVAGGIHDEEPEPIRRCALRSTCW
jgi:hypothetical protein